MGDLDEGLVLRDPSTTRLGEAFRTGYKRRRAITGESRGLRRSFPKLRPGTMHKHDMALRLLEASLGSVLLDSITPADAER